MTIELYWGSGSPYAWRVMLALEIKHVSYESKLLRFDKREHKTPEFMSLNPRGKVPAMRDGEFVLFESLAMLAYIDRKYPDPPLFGRTPEEAGTVMRWISEYDSYVEDAFNGVVRPLFQGTAAERGDEIRVSATTAREELARVEHALERSPWMVGTAITAADLVWFPSIQLLIRASERPDASELNLAISPIASRYPSIAAWIRRIESIAGYEKTYPPHWRS